MCSKYSTTEIDSVSYSANFRTITIELKRNDSHPEGEIGGLEELIPQNGLFVTVRSATDVGNIVAIDISFNTVGELLQLDMDSVTDETTPISQVTRSHHETCCLCFENFDTPNLLWLGTKSQSDQIQSRNVVCKRCISELQSQINRLFNKNEPVVVTESV